LDHQRAGSLGAIDGGVMITSTPILMGTAHHTVFPVLTAGAGMGLASLQGAADLVMVPDRNH
jgi:glutamine synthetase